MDEFTRIFLEEANKYPEWQEALDIVKKNSNHGNTWLIGGFLFRNIIRALYKTEKPACDLDFIIEKPVKYFNLPSDWKVNTNSFGNIKLVGPKYPIDYVPLDNIRSIKERKLQPTIENFLTGTPLNVQSICYDVNQNKVIGEIGLDAIKTRILRINNLDEAINAAKLKYPSVSGIPLICYIQKMAGLGFQLDVKL